MCGDGFAIGDWFLPNLNNDYLLAIWNAISQTHAMQQYK